eukprot:TRINITY_DN9943_c1_g1_i1.p1 TRINITY_DN9943_c1_g1~~TRINITY_DN9943_c1_g1_i1.p1  ORF type:complete len:250 (+),score=45.51 TRINITY_DN9943_c1_g1_i1:88-837(+)
MSATGAKALGVLACLGVISLAALGLAGCGKPESKHIDFAAGEFDCEADFSSWRTGWSDEKISWCCAKKHVACDSHSADKVAPKNPSNHVTDDCWSAHESMPSNAHDNASAEQCAKYEAKLCSWSQVGSDFKKCFPKICVDEHLAKEISERGHAETHNFTCHSVNPSEHVTDDCWDAHQAMPAEAHDSPSAEHCAKYDAKVCTWNQWGSDEKKCFPEICVDKHLEKEISVRGQAEVKNFSCHAASDVKTE